MEEELSRLFGLVCGQNNCWAPAGEVLPFCQRCTGLYAGAAVAAFLHLVFRPRPTPLLLWTHGMLLLLMVPFGYHLVPQNGALRTLTGQLFAMGLVCYLSLLPAARVRRRPVEAAAASPVYAACALATLVALQGAVTAGGRLPGAAITWLGCLGFATLTLLAVANVVLLPGAVRRLMHKRSACVPS